MLSPKMTQSYDITASSGYRQNSGQFDRNKFYRRSYSEKNQSNPVDQRACHVILNPVGQRIVQQQQQNRPHNDQLLPSKRQLFAPSLRPSTICYQTFKNEDSPFSSPLKRSSTFTGVFNSLFNQSDYNHLIEPNPETYQNKLRYSKSNYSYDYENRFTSSEPLPNEQLNKQQLISISNSSLLTSLKDLQSIKQNLMSMAVGLTRHSSSNTGRIIEQPANQINKQQISKAVPSSLSNSSSSSACETTPSTSVYTNNEASTVVAVPEDLPPFNLNFCTLCLQYIDSSSFIILDSCKCGFCRPCMQEYCNIIIRDHSLTSSQITCPSADCPSLNGYLAIDQVRELVDDATFRLYEKIKLDFEVHLDPNRVWCPRPNCETVCTVSDEDLLPNDCGNFESRLDLTDRRVPVYCKNCNLTFCLHCRSAYHGTMPCQSPSEDESLSLLLSRIRTPNSLNEFIKKCPRCGIFIERDRGCAQMMCQKCKHVFCWFCLSSLEEDFLLRHYDSGACKNKLGHSKAHLIWLRFQVIAVFLGFALFLLLMSPLLLICAPILLVAHYFCNLSISTKIWTKEDYLDSVDQSQNNLHLQQPLSKTTRNRAPDPPNAAPSNGQAVEQLIDLSEPNDQANETNQEPPVNKHQQLIQAYIQSNGAHKLIQPDQSLGLTDNILNSGLFEEHPIQLSGYDPKAEKSEEKTSGFFSWFAFGRRKPKAESLPRLSSMLDVEKHRRFIEEELKINQELIADRLSLDNQLNSVEIGNHYMIINAPETEAKPTGSDQRRWWSFWSGKA